MEELIMDSLDKLDKIYVVEYRSKAICSPLYVRKRNTYEQGNPDRWVTFEEAIKIVKEKKLFFSAEGSAFRSSWDLAVELNSMLGLENCSRPRMIYYNAKKNNTEIPEEVFAHISKKTLNDWYESLYKD